MPFPNFQPWLLNWLSNLQNFGKCITCSGAGGATIIRIQRAGDASGKIWVKSPLGASQVFCETKLGHKSYRNFHVPKKVDIECRMQPSHASLNR